MESEELAHIMVDIETLGTGKDAVVTQLGAVSVVMTPSGHWQIGKAFSRGLKIEPQLSKGATINEDTLRWWFDETAWQLKQGVDVSPFAATTETPRDVLLDFSYWLRVQAHRYVVWGKGSDFDIAIVEMAFRRAGLTHPWGHRQVACLRTLMRLHPIQHHAKPYIKHEAVSDASAQATDLINTAETHGLDLTRF